MRRRNQLFLTKQNMLLQKREEGKKKPITPPLQGEEQCKELCVPTAAGSLPYQGVSQSTPLLYRALQGSKESALGGTSRNETPTSIQIPWTNTKQPQRAQKLPKPIEETPPAHVCETQASVTPRCAHPRHRIAMRCADPHTERNWNGPIEARVCLKSFRPSPELV